MPIKEQIRDTTPVESIVHRQVCDWIRLIHPNVLFWSDGSGNFLTRTQAGMAKMLRSSGGVPDLFIALPRGKYHGCFIELKRESAAVYLKTGVLSTNPHIQQQAEVLQSLTNAGYYANFGLGYEDTVRQLSWYFKLPGQPT